MVTRIMVVDDEPAIGRLLIYQLHECGFQASYVGDGLMALERFTRERPDLVLLDVMMPTINGRDVCRQLRTISQVPIIMLTAKRTDADVAAGLQAGADDYLGKPFSMIELKARIEAVLRRVRQKDKNEPNETVRHEALVGKPLIASPHPSIGAGTLPPVLPPPTDQPLHLGQHLRAIRLEWGVSLHQAATDCHTRWEFLQAIEQENFSYVPRLQLREALNAYTTYLGLNLQTLVGQPKQSKQSLWISPSTTAALIIVLLMVSLLVLSTVH